MATILDTLVTRLGFQTDTKGLDKGKKGLGDFKATAFKVAAGVGAILGGGLFLNAIADTADETLKWADANGIAVESIGELEFAVQRQGGSIEGLRSSLSNMNKSIGEVERGTGRAKLAFEDYGISIKKANGETKTADELFLDVNKKFVGLSKAKQFDLAMKMGIDKGTIRLLQTAPDEVERLTREAAKLGVLSRKDAEAAAKFNDGLTNMGQVINSIKFEIAGFIFEPLAKFFKILANGIAFVKDHKNLMLSIVGIIGAVALAYTVMGIKAAIAWAIAFAPVTLIIAAIGLLGVALAVIGEDFIAFFKGQSSFIGDMVNKFWPSFEAAIASVGEFLRELTLNIVSTFKAGIEWGGKMIQKIKDIGKAILDFLTKPIRDLIALVDKIPSIDIGGGVGDFFGGLNPFGDTAVPAGLTPAFAGGGQLLRRNNSLSIGAINVDASGSDSKEIVQQINTELKTQLQNTVEDFDSAIDR